MGCSFGADQVAHPAHLNARNTTLAFASRAPQAEIQGLKQRHGWEHIPWYTITDDFDKDFDVDEWHGTNAFIRDGDRIFRTYFIDARGDEQMGNTWNYLDITALGRQEAWEDFAGGLPANPAVPVVELPRRLQPGQVITPSRECRWRGLPRSPAVELVEPLHREQRPLPAPLTGLNHLDGRILVAVGQIPELLRQHIQSDGSLVLGVSCTISLANSSSAAWRPDRSDTRTCLTATAGLLGRTRAKPRGQRRLLGLERHARQSHAHVKDEITQHDQALMKPDSQRLTPSGSVMSTTVRVLRDPSQVARIVILEHLHGSQLSGQVVSCPVAASS